MLQTGNRPVHGILNILGKRAGHPAQIHFVCIFSLRLNKYLMTIFISKFNHLILYGRTVAGTGSLNKTGKEGRSVQILPDDPVGLFICIGQPTGDLFPLDRFRICGKGKGNDPLISELLLHL